MLTYLDGMEASPRFDRLSWPLFLAALIMGRGMVSVQPPLSLTPLPLIEEAAIRAASFCCWIKALAPPPGRFADVEVVGTFEVPPFLAIPGRAVCLVVDGATGILLEVELPIFPPVTVVPGLELLPVALVFFMFHLRKQLTSVVGT